MISKLISTEAECFNNSFIIVYGSKNNKRDGSVLKLLRMYQQVQYLPCINKYNSSFASINSRPK